MRRSCYVIMLPLPLQIMFLFVDVELMLCQTLAASLTRYHGVVTAMRCDVDVVAGLRRRHTTVFLDESIVHPLPRGQIATAGGLLPCSWSNFHCHGRGRCPCKSREGKTGEMSNEGVQHPKGEVVCGLGWLWRSLTPCLSINRQPFSRGCHRTSSFDPPRLTL